MSLGFTTKAIRRKMLFLCMACFLLSGCGNGKDASEEKAGQLPQPQFYDTETVTEAGLESEPVLLVVHVCGEVNNPGVVLLPEGSRVADALALAGGFTPNAATDSINLAAFVEDGQQIMFPDVEQAKEQQKQREMEESGRVNINTADIRQLMNLPGIGESRAQDIVRYREQNGPFSSKEELMLVPGIKENSYRKLEDKIEID